MAAIAAMTWRPAAKPEGGWGWARGLAPQVPVPLLRLSSVTQNQEMNFLNLLRSLALRPNRKASPSGL